MKRQIMIDEYNFIDGYLNVIFKLDNENYSFLKNLNRI